jgi:hypothetical protein
MVALAQVVAWVAVCGEPCQLVTVDLPAGHMFDQVTAIAHKRHLQWLFNLRDVDPHTPVPALRGTFTVNEALRRIFDHTPYTFEFETARPGRGPFFWVDRVQVCGLAHHGSFPIPPCVRQVLR